MQPMQSAKGIGRVVGVLLLVQALLAPAVYTQWGMIGTLTTPGFLASAAAHATQIRVALLLTLVLSALTLAVALIAVPLFRIYSERMALLFLALAAIGLTTQVMETHASRTMLSISLSYANGGVPKEVLEALAPSARSTWHSAHFTNLMLGHLKMLVFYGIMYRSVLVPRALAAVGLAATVLSTTAATMPLLGLQFSYPMIAPAALAQLALTLWLIIMGFADAARAGESARTWRG